MAEQFSTRPQSATEQRGLLGRLRSFGLLSWRWLKEPQHTVISVAALLFLFDTFVKPLSAVALGMLLIVAAPYLLTIVKSFELPGGFKFELREQLDAITEKAEEAGLLEIGPEEHTGAAYQEIFPRDPVLALAGLRIEIEQVVRALAQHGGVLPSRGRPLPLPELIARLQSVGTLNPNEAGVLLDLLPILNRAVHTKETDAGAAVWAMDVGPRLISALKDIENLGAKRQGRANDSSSVQ